jgi:hypothetical protein
MPSRSRCCPKGIAFPVEVVVFGAAAQPAFLRLTVDEVGQVHSAGGP